MSPCGILQWTTIYHYILPVLILVSPPGIKAENIRIGVAEGVPEVAMLLEQAVAAGAGTPTVRDREASVEPHEPLAIPQHICSQASEGIQASVGGVEGTTAAARAGLLLLLSAPAPSPSPAPSASSTDTDLSLSAALELYPRYDVVAEACAALCEAKGWRHAVLLHEGSASAAPFLAPDHDTLALRIRRLPPAQDDDALRNLLLVLKKWGAVNFIVWCSAPCAIRVLDAAQRVGLLAERHAYLLPALDLHTLPLADFSYGGANITALRLFDPESGSVIEAMEKLRRQYTNLLGEEGNEQINDVIANPPTSLLLSYDAAQIVSAALQYLDLPTMDDSPSCSQGTAAFHADTVLNYLRSEERMGASGALWWEASGARGGVRLHATELERGGGLRAAAEWSRSGGLAWRARPPAPPPPPDVMTNRTFTVLIAENQPYIMRQQSADRLTGNARYEGFCIELVDRLAQLLHFNYTFIEQADRAYGVLNKTTKKWNGMMKRLMDDKNIDFAITDLTITAEREEAVDFTTPFMNLGIGILFHKPQPPAPELLAFLLPFSNGVAFLCIVQCGWVAEGVPEVAMLLEQAVAAGAGTPTVRDREASVEPHEPLAIPQHICSQASEGIQASVGGVEGTTAAARAGLLLLLSAPAPSPSPAPSASSTDTDLSLSAALELYPRYDVVAEACAALCEAKGWRHAVLLHEGSASAAPFLAPDHDTLALRIRRLPPAQDDDALRNLLLVLKKWGAVNFIVWCSAPCAIRVLDAAQRVGLLAERHAYLLPALDLHTLPLADFSYGGANITALRLFDPESGSVIEAMEKLRRQYTNLLGEEGNEQINDVIANPPTSLLLSYDAAQIVSAALQYLDLPTMDDSPSCSQGTAAFHADTVLNYLRSEERMGASGALWWEASGARGGVRLHATELERGGGLRAAAEWSRSGGLAWRARPPAPPPPPDVMTNRTFTVLIAENQPYIMRQQSADRLTGNARYEGFCIELVDRLAQLLHFNYTFIEQADRAYGVLNKTTKKWNGMMKRLMDDKNIDFAITDLTITAEREEAVDFTTPFMNLGIGILFHKPQPPAPELLAFLLPFSNGVWTCLGLAYVGTSLVLYVVGRLCPEEWQNPYPCIEEPPALENQFTLANALWFNLGAVLQQGSEIAPVAYGTRAVASVWWMFALVITSSYTANLATLLASKTSTELIRNVRDLADNDQGITYGAKGGGSTYTFFEMSSVEPYKSMFQKMKEETMPSSNDAGIEKVMNEKYAFFAESTTIDYTTERNCDVTRVGDLLDSKGYGLAMKKNSPYRQAMNLALLNLQEAGVLREMKHRWWKEMHGGGACQDKEDHATERLSIANFKGLFLVLTVGCALGVVVSCCDLAWSAWRHPRDPSRSFAASFWSELRFVFRFERSEKPVRGSLTPAPSSPESPASARSDRSEVTCDGDVGGEDAAREEDSGSRRSARSRRTGVRRCSMHTASLRLARHTTPRR